MGKGIFGLGPFKIELRISSLFERISNFFLRPQLRTTRKWVMFEPFFFNFFGQKSTFSEALSPLLKFFQKFFIFLAIYPPEGKKIFFLYNFKKIVKFIEKIFFVKNIFLWCFWPKRWFFVVVQIWAKIAAKRCFFFKLKNILFL